MKLCLLKTLVALLQTLHDSKTQSSEKQNRKPEDLFKTEQHCFSAFWYLKKKNTHRFVSEEQHHSYLFASFKFLNFAVVLMDGLIQKEKKEVSADYLNKIFVFTLMWSIGALLELEDRTKLQTFISGACMLESLYCAKRFRWFTSRFFCANVLSSFV